MLLCTPTAATAATAATVARVARPQVATAALVVIPPLLGTRMAALAATAVKPQPMVAMVAAAALEATVACGCEQPTVTAPQVLPLPNSLLEPVAVVEQQGLAARPQVATAALVALLPVLAIQAQVVPLEIPPITQAAPVSLALMVILVH